MRPPSTPWWIRAPWSKNPLLRRSDRWDGVLAWLTITFVLLLIPVAATVGAATYAALNDQAAYERSTAVEVDATITDGPIPRRFAGDSIDAISASASATWTSPDGNERVEKVHVDSDAQIGDPVVVWVDSQGRMIDAPMTGIDAACLGVTAAAVLWFTAAAVAVVSSGFIRHLRNRRRMSLWEREWEKFDDSRGKSIGW